MRTPAAVVLGVLTATVAHAQAPRNDATTPLHLMKPDYPIPYGATTPEAVTEVLRRVHGFIDASTPLGWVDAATNAPLADLATAKGAVAPTPGAFRITSYEWGVTYSGMLRAGEATGDPRFAQYVASRLAAVPTRASWAPSARC
jgi:unsaturated rhamnogalacturonyl hydrolase